MQKAINVLCLILVVTILALALSVTLLVKSLTVETPSNAIGQNYGTITDPEDKP